MNILRELLDFGKRFLDEKKGYRRTDGPGQKSSHAHSPVPGHDKKSSGKHRLSKFPRHK